MTTRVFDLWDGYNNFFAWKWDVTLGEVRTCSIHFNFQLIGQTISCLSHLITQWAWASWSNYIKVVTQWSWVQTMVYLGKCKGQVSDYSCGFLVIQ